MLDSTKDIDLPFGVLATLTKRTIWSSVTTNAAPQ
jgi:hypothetical protein